jgi:DNA polymerase-3 subunit beta
MKITVLAENLKRGLNIVNRGISSRPQLPILSGVLVKANNEGLFLVSTDLEMSFWMKMGAKVVEEGDIVMPAKLFTELVLSLPAGPVDIFTENLTLKIVAGLVKAEIVGQSADDFPVIPRLKKAQVILNAGEFREKVEKVSVSAAKDDTRPILTGVLWDFGEEKISLVATDGYRLSVDNLSIDKKVDNWSGRLILPAKSLQEVAKTLTDTGEDKVEVEFDKENQQVIFGLKEMEIASRLIAGEFPPYQQILPNTYKTRTELDREGLLEAVKRARLFARENANIVKLMLDGQSVKVTAESSQFGNNSTELEVTTEGENLTVAFNALYLLDYLNICKEDIIFWETEGELKPSVFKTSDENWLQVIMPVRVQQ